MNLLSIRRWHSYIGLFTAPSVLFFALTGVLQIFSLHEAHGSYKPLAIVEKLSSVHKDQVFELGHHHDSPPAGAGEEKPDAAKASTSPADDDDKTELPTLLLKWFFCLVALGLALSTAFGLWMGLTQMRRKPVAWLLLIAGTLIPVVLLLVSFAV